MSIKESVEFCDHCQAQTLVTQKTPNHWRHFFLTVLLGVWIVPWIIAAFKKPDWICSKCKNKVNVPDIPTKIKKCYHCGTKNKADEYRCMNCNKVL